MGALPIHSVETLRLEPVVVVAIRGEIDAGCSAALSTQLDEAITSSDCHVVLDLLDVSFIDSTGVGALLAAQRRLNRVRRRIALVVGEGAVSSVLQVTGLTHHFDTFPRVDDAADRLSSAPLVGR